MAGQPGKMHYTVAQSTTNKPY